MTNFVVTGNASSALEMANTVRAARDDARVGQIIGGPGTGKTAVGHYLTRELGAIRICAWEGMGKKAMLVEIAKRLGLNVRASNDLLIAQILTHCTGRLFIIDEANHLRWNVIEMLRIFIDEGFASLVLIGTDLLDRKFRSAQTEIYLAQMSQRIGAKRVTFKPMAGAEEIAGYVISPRFGQVTAKTAKAFLKISKGNWRIALELADACERVMRAENISKLDEQLVQTASAWLARNN